MNKKRKKILKLNTLLNMHWIRIDLKLFKVEMNWDDWINRLENVFLYKCINIFVYLFKVIW